MTTLSEAKADLLVRFNSGEASECPCCRQTVKKYPRTITAVMAAQLIQMYRANGSPVHYKDLRDKKGGDADYAKLRHWGLAEEHLVGYWRITDRGRVFVEGMLMVPRKAFIFDNKVRGFSTDTMSIWDALGTKFSYAELMNPANARPN